MRARKISISEYVVCFALYVRHIPSGPAPHNICQYKSLHWSLTKLSVCLTSLTKTKLGDLLRYRTWWTSGQRSTGSWSCGSSARSTAATASSLTSTASRCLSVILGPFLTESESETLSPNSTKSLTLWLTLWLTLTLMNSNSHTDSLTDSNSLTLTDSD